MTAQELLEFLDLWYAIGPSHKRDLWLKIRPRSAELESARELQAIEQAETDPALKAREERVRVQTIKRALRPRRARRPNPELDQDVIELLSHF